tara:strand:- start:40979 stop:41212 length:234 start_codon:yes stop_codon:yes gene_type:complete
MKLSSKKFFVLLFLGCRKTSTSDGVYNISSLGSSQRDGVDTTARLLWESTVASITSGIPITEQSFAMGGDIHFPEQR